MKTKKRAKLGQEQHPVCCDLLGIAIGKGVRFDDLNHNGVSKSLKFMAQNYTRPIQVGDVAAEVGMSRSGIARAFGKHTGVSPGLIIRRARIEFAKRLLIEKDLPLKSIAALTGFSSENTFCIAFQRTTGLAPKKYQRKAWLTALSRR